MQHDRNSGKLSPVSGTKMYQLAKIVRIPALVPNVLCFLDLNLCCIEFCEVSHVSNS